MIVVTGAPRSGTSMTCQVLEALGVDFGRHCQPAGPANPHGFYENILMRRQVTKPWLQRLDADPLGQWPLPDRDWRPSQDEVEAFHEAASEAIDGKAVKDPKLLLLWPLIHAAFPEARWVLVRREPEAIAASCQRTNFMRLHGTIEGWLEWVERLEERMADLVLSGADVVSVWPDPSDVDSFWMLANTLGLDWDERKVERVLHPESWRVV